MSSVVETAPGGDPPLPPIPEGAVMVTLRIARFNPENPDQYADSGGWQSFRVPCLPSDRLLNLLIYIKSYLDGTLTFRRSCAHGICGSDAMRINGVNRLACKVLMRDLLPGKPRKQLTITVEPIRGLPVEKDLVVDMEPFFEAYRAVKPYLITGVLERGQLLRPGGHRQRAPLHLRQPRRGGRRAPRHPQRGRRGVALPHHVQLHRVLPAGHRGDQGHSGGQARVDVQPLAFSPASRRQSTHFLGVSGASASARRHSPVTPSQAASSD
jgi:succinate dehydrogenase iron-sulfur subunit